MEEREEIEGKEEGDTEVRWREGRKDKEKERRREENEKEPDGGEGRRGRKEGQSRERGV